MKWSPLLKIVHFLIFILIFLQNNSALKWFTFQPIQLVGLAMDVAKPGKIPAGKTEIPFEVPLQPKLNKVLYETYHGVFVNIQVSQIICVIFF